jgi:hypothetical protein
MRRGRAAHSGHRQIKARGWDLLAKRLQIRARTEHLSLPRRQSAHPDHALRYQTSLPDCRAYVLKPTCCPNMPSRRIVRDIRVKRPEFITLLGGAAARPPNRQPGPCAQTSPVSERGASLVLAAPARGAPRGVHCASVFDQRCERIFARRLAYRGIGPSGVESRRIGV